jgi:hypothetical protein
MARSVRYYERGRPVEVITWWTGAGPRNVLIRREDGTRTVRPFRGLRRRPPTGEPAPISAPDARRAADQTSR